MLVRTVLFALLMALIAHISLADYDDLAMAVPMNFVKKGRPQGPMRFGKRRSGGPSGPLRFGKRSGDMEVEPEPYMFIAY